MSTGAVITQKQRAALYSLFLAGLGEFLDLERATQDGDLETCNRIGRRLLDGLRLVLDGGLGWGDGNGGDQVVLTLPREELNRILSAMRQDAVALEEDLSTDHEERIAELGMATLAREACDQVLHTL